MMNRRDDTFEGRFLETFMSKRGQGRKKEKQRSWAKKWEEQKKEAERLTDLSPLPYSRVLGRSTMATTRTKNYEEEVPI